jgi:hypothetical protein
VIEKIHSRQRARRHRPATKRRGNASEEDGKRRLPRCSRAAPRWSSPPAAARPRRRRGSSSSSGVVDITWQTMWSGNTLTLLSQMVNAFNSTHPDIHVTESNIPSATGDAKLLSEIAAGDPPDVFTEWNPVLGEYAADGTIQSMTPYLTGTYAGLEKWEYPIALQGGQYKGTLYALPMSMNSWALYYNKSMHEGGRHLLAAHDAGAALRRPGQGVEDLGQQAQPDRLLPDLQPGLRVLRQLLRRGQLLQLGRAVRLRRLQGRADRGELPRPVRQVPVRGRRRLADGLRGGGRRR